MIFLLTHRHSGLPQVQPDGQVLPHEDVRVVAGVERSLKLLKLPLGKVGATAALVGAAVAAAAAAAVIVAAGDRGGVVRVWWKSNRCA